MSIWPVSLVMVAKMHPTSSLDNPQSGWQRANAAPAVGTTAWGGLHKIPHHPFSSMKRTMQFSTRPQAHWTTHLKLPLPAAIDIYPDHFLQLNSMQDTHPSRRTNSFVQWKTQRFRRPSPTLTYNSLAWQQCRGTVSLYWWTQWRVLLSCNPNHQVAPGPSWHKPVHCPDKEKTRQRHSTTKGEYWIQHTSSHLLWLSAHQNLCRTERQMTLCHGTNSHVSSCSRSMTNLSSIFPPSWIKS
jgi:hypothetical protein